DWWQLWVTQTKDRVEKNSGRKQEVKKRSLNSLREALRINTWNWVSEMAKPWGRVYSASQPTTVSTSSILSTTVPSGWPRQSLINWPLVSFWAVEMILL